MGGTYQEAQDLQAVGRGCQSVDQLRTALASFDNGGSAQQLSNRQPLIKTQTSWKTDEDRGLPIDAFPSTSIAQTPDPSINKLSNGTSAKSTAPRAAPQIPETKYRPFCIPIWKL